MDRIPHDVETLVRQAAQAGPGYAGDLTDVRLRARRHRTRQAVAAFAGVVAVIAAAGIGVAVQRAPSVPVDPPVASVPPPAPSGPAFAQRLLLNGANGTYRTFDNGRTVQTRLDAGNRIAEFQPGWVMTTREVVGADRWDTAIGLGDGSVVALGPRGPATNLVRAGAGGQVDLERDVRRPGEKVTLLTATEDAAYLWRPAGLVSHDLATGTEYVLFTPGALGLTDPFDGSVVAADLVGTRLVLARKDDPCLLRLYDLDRGSPADEIPLSANMTCSGVSGVRLSPDTSKVAVVTPADDGPGITTADVGTGALLDSMTVEVQPTEEDTEVVLSWSDVGTVRGVAFAAGGGSYDLVPFTLTP